METPRAATCSLFPEQEPRLAPGEKHEAKRGQSDGRRRTKALLWGRNPGWPRGSLRPPRGPRRPARPRPGGVVSSSGAGPLPSRGGAAPDRNGGCGQEGEGRRGAGSSTALPSPAVSMATATSPRRLGELQRESLPVAAQRPSDVRRLSLVPKVTDQAAGPGTICVCPQRVCGASGVWRS